MGLEGAEARGLLLVSFVPLQFSLVTVTGGASRGIWTSRTPGGRSPSLELLRSDATDPDLEDSEGVSGTKERHIPAEIPSKSVGLK